MDEYVCMHVCVCVCVLNSRAFNKNCYVLKNIYILGSVQ